jgi:hypothetical protein
MRKTFLSPSIIIAVLVVAGFGVAWKLTKNETPSPVACTAEAKICPDGSAVGRTGPNCEFTKCPSTTFTREGNLTSGNPGQKAGAWYLVYEMAGAPAMSTELVFNADSLCAGAPCNTNIFTQGERVSISGEVNGDAVIVSTLSPAGSNSGILPFKSGVRGTVTLGPICPVIQNPPDPQCADKPYQTTVQVIAIGSPKSSPFAVVQTNKDGEYIFAIPPGEYALQAVGGKMFPSCALEDIIVQPDVMSVVDLSCDTGIR